MYYALSGLNGEILVNTRAYWDQEQIVAGPIFLNHELVVSNSITPIIIKATFFSFSLLKIE